MAGHLFWCFGSIFPFSIVTIELQLHKWVRRAQDHALVAIYLCIGVGGVQAQDALVYFILKLKQQKQTIRTTINRKSLAVRSGTPSKTNSLSGSLQILVLAKTKCLRVNVFRFKRELANITPN